MSAKALREAAVILLQQADLMEGKPPTFMGQQLPAIMAMWEAMQKQFAAEDTKVNEEFQIGRIVTAYNPVIEAAHKGRWPSDIGGAYWLGNYKTAAALSASIRALMQTAQYREWAADSRNANLVPKAEPSV